MKLLKSNSLIENSQESKNRQESKNSFFAGCIKILVVHFQIMPLLKKIDFSWENSTYSFLTYQTYLGNSAEAINSFDCLIISKQI